MKFKLNRKSEGGTPTCGNTTQYHYRVAEINNANSFEELGKAVSDFIQDYDNAPIDNYELQPVPQYSLYPNNTIITDLPIITNTTWTQ